jgi:hypothetical protein
MSERSVCGPGAGNGDMKIRIKVRNVVTGREWTEDYDKNGIGDNGGNVQQAEDWAFQLIKRFNETCRPGEYHRELLSTELLGTSTLQHDWYKRTDGMSVNFKGRLVDLFECRKCGITGKRLSLGSSIRRDSKYRGKKFESCGREDVELFHRVNSGRV